MIPVLQLANDIRHDDHGEGRSTIESTGPDPYVVFTLASPDHDPASHSVLEFDYTSPSGVDELKLYYFDKTPDEEHSVRLGELPPAPGWMPFSANILARDVHGTWGAFRFLRLDFGTGGRTALTIANPRIRTMNKEEIEQSRIDAALLEARRARAKAEMSYLHNGLLRVGVDLSLGGAITFLSASGSGDNLVNNADWGRQIQMSFYSGPVPYVSGDKKPARHWQHLGWNPVQSGDDFRNPSRVVSHANDGETLYVKAVPMQWPLDDVPGDCFFESWLRLEGNTVRVRARLTNRREDKTQYEARSQELPAIYVNGPWHRLVTYDGDAPFTHGGLSLKNSAKQPGEFPWNFWLATENWAALVDDANHGLGVWMPESGLFLGNFVGTPGVGGPSDQSTGYMSPLLREVIDHDIVYTYEYTLILGTIEEIRSFVYQHGAAGSPRSWVFDSDRQHWHYVNARDAGWPPAGALEVHPLEGIPLLVGPYGFWKAEESPRLRIRAAFPEGADKGRVLFKRFAEFKLTDEPHFGSGGVEFPVVGDGVVRDYTVDLSRDAAYSGGVVQFAIQLSATPSGPDAAPIRIHSIQLLP